MKASRASVATVIRGFKRASRSRSSFFIFSWRLPIASSSRRAVSRVSSSAVSLARNSSKVIRPSAAIS